MYDCRRRCPAVGYEYDSADIREAFANAEKILSLK